MSKVVRTGSGSCPEFRRGQQAQALDLAVLQREHLLRLPVVRDHPNLDALGVAQGQQQGRMVA